MYLIPTKQRFSIYLEEQDICLTCRFNGMSNICKPCAFIEAACANMVSSIPYEHDNEVFYVNRCGAYIKRPVIVRSESDGKRV